MAHDPVPRSRWTDDEWMRAMREFPPDAPSGAVELAVGRWRQEAAPPGDAPPGVSGYVVFVPFASVASMAYGNNGQPDMATVATEPGHLAGPFRVITPVRGQPPF